MWNNRYIFEMIEAICISRMWSIYHTQFTVKKNRWRTFPKTLNKHFYFPFQYSNRNSAHQQIAVSLRLRERPSVPGRPIFLHPTRRTYNHQESRSPTFLQLLSPAISSLAHLTQPFSSKLWCPMNIGHWFL